jgi:thioredoxin-like negative regulator of GroEL
LYNLRDADEQAVFDILKHSTEPVVVFLHSPFCGTCHLAERMLDIALEAIKAAPSGNAGGNASIHAAPAVYRCNVNVSPRLVQTWEVESVPCLIAARCDEVVERMYAFRSVDDVYDFLMRIWASHS